MEKMSKNNEKKLLRALDKAANLSRSGLEPNHVLTKVAGEFQLTSSEICRVVETFNKAKSVAFLKSASSDIRANDFPLADSKEVVKNIFGEQEKTADVKDIPLKNFAAMCSYEKGCEKVASEKTETVRERSCDRDKGSIWKEAMVYAETQKSLKQDLLDDYASTRQTLEKSMLKIAKHCEFARDKELKKVARLIINSYGKQGENFIDDINQRMLKPSLPKVEKTAFAAMFPVGAPYIDIAEAFTSGEKLVKIAKNIDYFDKQAGGDIISALGGKAIDEVLKAPKKTSPAYIDPRSGLSPEFDNYLKSLQAKKMLYNLYRFDPIIKSYPLEDVTDMYNEISELTPSLSNNKAWMRAATRRMLTQGKAADPFELQQMMSGEESKTKAMQNYVGTLKDMYGEAEKGAKTDNKEIKVSSPTTVNQTIK